MLPADPERQVELGRWLSPCRRVAAAVGGRCSQAHGRSSTMSRPSHDRTSCDRGREVHSGRSSRHARPAPRTDAHLPADPHRQPRSVPEPRRAARTDPHAPGWPCLPDHPSRGHTGGPSSARSRGRPARHHPRLRAVLLRPAVGDALPTRHRLGTRLSRGPGAADLPRLHCQALAVARIGFVFSDGHGLARFTAWYDDLADLDRVDWDMVYQRYWRDTSDDMDRQRRKQAEFLVHRSAVGTRERSRRLQRRSTTTLGGHPDGPWTGLAAGSHKTRVVLLKKSVQ